MMRRYCNKICNKELAKYKISMYSSNSHTKAKQASLMEFLKITKFDFALA